MGNDKISFQTKVSLNDGNAIPILGFGVYQVENGSQCEGSVSDALEAGYRLIDTAYAYKNEESVGRAIANSGIPRKDLFITTKTPFDLSVQNIQTVFKQSLEKLMVDYVDLYLIHWPVEDSKIPAAWETLEALKEEGGCRSIGVSNFTVERFEKAFFGKIGTIPALNQIELHIFNKRAELINYCKNYGMAAQSYSPLARGLRFDNPVLSGIARDIDKSIAQVMLRYLVQKGIPVIPKSKTKERILENADIFDFELGSEQMKKLEELDEGLFVQEWRPKGFY